MEELTQASHKMAEKMYQGAGPEAGAPGAGPGAGPDAPPSDPNVVDAELRAAEPLSFDKEMEKASNLLIRGFFYSD